jgi:hypothetical protein
MLAFFSITVHIVNKIQGPSISHALGVQEIKNTIQRTVMGDLKAPQQNLQKMEQDFVSKKKTAVSLPVAVAKYRYTIYITNIYTWTNI